MSISKKIRLASVEDSTELLNIYSPFIKNTAVTFEYDVPTTTEFADRIQSVMLTHPWLVYEMNDKIVGYAYASRHRERAAYQWSVEVAIYIDPKYHRMNIATELYSVLMELLRLQGYYNAYAGITLPNQKSVGFHEAYGFQPVGIYHNVGYKFNEWYDVQWLSFELSEYSIKPVKTRTINEIKDTSEYIAVLSNAIK